MHTPTHQLVTRVEVLALRALMILMALATALVGASLLSTPLALPLVLGLWLGAFGMLALGMWGQLPSDV